MPPSSPGTRPGAQAHSFSALKSLLADLGSQVRRGRGLAREVAETPACCPTGVARLDARLGGGFPRGRLSELCGAPSSGRTSLATTLLAETLARGVLAAWIDPADAFDPVSTAGCLAARDGGAERGDGSGDLQRLLWVRARSEKEAIRSAARILQTEGFELIVLDLAHARGRAPRGPENAIPDASWLRLARLAARGQSALVVLSNTPQAGSRAELVLEMQRRSTRFSGLPPLLDALETTAVLRRHRTRPTGQEVPLSLDAAPDTDAAPDSHPPLDSNPHAAPDPVHN